MNVADLVRVARDPRSPVHRRHAAFSVLVDRFQAMALAVAMEGCGDAETARDASQDAFLVAWRTLPGLRDPDAFGGWLKRLVRTQCSKARRAAVPLEGPIPCPVAPDPSDTVLQQERRHHLARSVRALPAAERAAVKLVYFQGASLEEAGRLLGVTSAHAGKLVHRARLHLRRALPREIARPFLATRPDRTFTRQVETGMLDELEGTYLFPERPDRPVVLRREGGTLVAQAAGQRNVLASGRANRLAATEFDGEVCFLRDRSGHVTGFVYYEFARRLGVARRVAG
ncbi:MAG TPA: sigma-70 family RNA polymerase sigma factor [Candidatus Polarisedimenticolaceae bacterium]|nr:sigma-70 family RNA polymerase sigma factor [Candidatus Polarisedimenticolaceae bacterium]